MKEEGAGLRSKEESLGNFDLEDLLEESELDSRSLEVEKEFEGDREAGWGLERAFCCGCLGFAGGAEMEREMAAARRGRVRVRNFMVDVKMWMPEL